MSQSKGAAATDSSQHYRVVASQISSVDNNEELLAGDEWVWYQELEIKEEDLKVRVDHFWCRVFDRTDVN